MTRPSIRKAGASWVPSAVILTTLVLAGCMGDRVLPDGVPMQEVGAWRIGVANTPDPARAGDNAITVVARDASGKAMHGSLEVVVSMPQMGAMPYMEARGTSKPKGPGVFLVSYGLPMRGEWDVTVRLRPDNGPPAEAHYRLSSSIRGLSFAGGTPPAGSGATKSPEIQSIAPDSGLGAVMIEAARRQSLGIRTDTVRVRVLSGTLRAPGRVAYDEAHQAEVSLKFQGWVRQLSANVTGQPVRRGQVLFKVYSPELWSAQQEYIEAARAAQADQGNAALSGSSSALAQSARERLTLWDLSPADIDAIAREGHPIEAMPIRSPVSGVVTEKGVVEGSAFQAGQVLFRIARLDPIWVIASVPEQDAALVHQGMKAIIRDPYRDTALRHGLVSFVYPSLDSMTRAAEVRVTIPNADGRLRPGSFVNVELVTPDLKRPTVPESAVLPTGERHIVFVDVGAGRLVPREVRLGARASGYYEVLGGLREGEVVVTSGNFLVAAESKLRTPSQKW
jgi:Cu(I)/Ag(I) efflux system membrane fusion protein